MKTLFLNLDKDFIPIISTNEIDYDTFTFPGGEVHIKIKYSEQLLDRRDTNVFITHRVKNMNDLMLILLAKDTLNNLGFTNINLMLPYLPYGRQDRRTSIYEPLSIKVFTNLINSAEFSKVIIIDPHSDVTSALLNNCIILDREIYITRSINRIREIYSFHGSMKPYIISPDAGAAKKLITTVSNNLRAAEISGFVRCDKVRNLETGQLSGFEVYAKDLEIKPCIIVDDICDGGGTFLGLATELKKKNAGALYLYVTHGIFSNGFDTLLEYFNRIFTTNSYQNINTKLVEQFRL